jgi:hypothetical protein
MSFLDFRSKFAKSAMGLNLRASLQFVAEHYFAGSRDASHHPRLLIFGVDEIAKTCLEDQPASQQQSRINAIVSLIGKLMDVFVVSGPRPVVAFPVVTSLSQVAIDFAANASNRAISWLPLGALKGAAMHAVRKLGISSSDTQVVRTVEMLCQYVGEHGRLLEILIDVIQSDSELFTDLCMRGPAAMPKIIAIFSQSSQARAYVSVRSLRCLFARSIVYFEHVRSECLLFAQSTLLPQMDPHTHTHTHAHTHAPVLITIDFFVASVCLSAAPLSLYFVRMVWASSPALCWGILCPSPIIRSGRI